MPGLTWERWESRAALYYATAHHHCTYRYVGKLREIVQLFQGNRLLPRAYDRSVHAFHLCGRIEWNLLQGKPAVYIVSSFGVLGDLSFIDQYPYKEKEAHRHIAAFPPTPKRSMGNHHLFNTEPPRNIDMRQMKPRMIARVKRQFFRQ